MDAPKVKIDNVYVCRFLLRLRRGFFFQYDISTHFCRVKTCRGKGWGAGGGGRDKIPFFAK